MSCNNMLKPEMAKNEKIISVVQRYKVYKAQDSKQ